MLELSKKVGVSEATISRWESGDIANMKRDKIVLLAKALNVTPSFIMEWDEPEHQNYFNNNQTDKIFNTYNKLNELGKQKADDYINDLADNPKYTVQEPTPLRLHTKQDTVPQKFINEDGEEMIILPVVARGGNNKPVIMTKKAYEEANKEFADIFDNDDDEEIIPLDED